MGEKRFASIRDEAVYHYAQQEADEMCFIVGGPIVSLVTQIDAWKIDEYFPFFPEEERGFLREYPHAVVTEHRDGSVDVSYHTRREDAQASFKEAIGEDDYEDD